MSNLYNTFILDSYASRTWGFYFQDSVSSQMEALGELYLNIMLYSCVVFFATPLIVITFIIWSSFHDYLPGRYFSLSGKVIPTILGYITDITLILFSMLVFICYFLFFINESTFISISDFYERDSDCPTFSDSIEDFDTKWIDNIGSISLLSDNNPELPDSSVLPPESPGGENPTSESPDDSDPSSDSSDHSNDSSEQVPEVRVGNIDECRESVDDWQRYTSLKAAQAESSMDHMENNLRRDAGTLNDDLHRSGLRLAQTVTGSMNAEYCMAQLESMSSDDPADDDIRERHDVMRRNVTHACWRLTAFHANLEETDNNIEQEDSSSVSGSENSGSTENNYNGNDSSSDNNDV